MLQSAEAESSVRAGSGPLGPFFAAQCALPQAACCSSLCRALAAVCLPHSSLVCLQHSVMSQDSSASQSLPPGWRMPSKQHTVHTLTPRPLVQSRHGDMRRTRRARPMEGTSAGTAWVHRCPPCPRACLWAAPGRCPMAHTRHHRILTSSRPTPPQGAWPAAACLSSARAANRGVSAGAD